MKTIPLPLPGIALKFFDERHPVAGQEACARMRSELEDEIRLTDEWPIDLARRLHFGGE